MNNQQQEKENNCTKPNCDCAEKEMIKQGTECIKSYPCLNVDTSASELKSESEKPNKWIEIAEKKCGIKAPLSNRTKIIEIGRLSNNSKVGEVNKPEGWMKSLIDCMHIDEANLKHIADTGIVNGTLLIEIKRVMQAYADNEKNIIRSVIQKEIAELEAELLYQIANVNNSTVILMVNAKIQILNKVLKLIQP